MERVVNDVVDGQPLEQVRLELARMTAYARALETRCNVFWAYVPGNQGSQDPIVPCLAEDCGITATATTIEMHLRHRPAISQEPAAALTLASEPSESAVVA